LIPRGGPWDPPSVSPTDEPLPNTTEKAPDDPDAFRVMLVDDNALVRRYITSLLVDQGMTVTTCDNGEEAFRVICASPFDLVVTDLEMGGIPGLHLCRMLRSAPATASLPIVVVTGEEGAWTRFRCEHAGADAWVVKRDFRQLPDIIRRLVGDRARSKSEGPPIEPLAQLCTVLDAEANRAVVLAEARALLSVLDEPEVFAQRCGQLLRGVLDAGSVALVLKLGGAERVVAVAPPIEASVLRQPVEPLVRVGDPSGSFFAFTERAHQVPIVVGSREIGALWFDSESAVMSQRDLDSGKWLAEGLAGPLEVYRLFHHIQHAATIDPLTNVANRRAMEKRLQAERARSSRYGVSFGLLLCDIDHFKSVNDTHGHAVGDDVLRQVAGALADTVRDVDMVGRWGGEEFVVLLSHQTRAGASVAAERLRRTVADLGPIDDGPARVTMSVGVAALEGEETVAELVKRADDALYEAKRSGRNRIALAPTPTRDD